MLFDMDTENNKTRKLVQFLQTHPPNTPYKWNRNNGEWDIYYYGPDER